MTGQVHPPGPRHVCMMGDVRTADGTIERPLVPAGWEWTCDECERAYTASIGYCTWPDGRRETINTWMRTPSEDA